MKSEENLSSRLSNESKETFYLINLNGETNRAPEEVNHGGHVKRGIIFESAHRGNAS